MRPHGAPWGPICPISKSFPWSRLQGFTYFHYRHNLEMTMAVSILFRYQALPIACTMERLGPRAQIHWFWSPGPWSTGPGTWAPVHWKRPWALVHWSQGPCPLVLGPGPLVPGPGHGPMVPGPGPLVPGPRPFRDLVPGPVPGPLVPGPGLGPLVLGPGPLVPGPGPAP